MSSRRDLPRELAYLLRAPEPGTNNLGAFVAEHAKTLCTSLGVREAELAAAGQAPDELLAPKLVARLESLKDARRAHLDAQGQSIAAAAADRLAHTARHEDGRVIVSTDVLLGDLLADRDILYLRFVHEGRFDMAVMRRTLAESARVQRLYMDVGAWLDSDGVHIRWRGGKGGYDWKPRIVPSHFVALVHTVRLHRPANAARQHRRLPSLIGDILTELGWPA